jgi:hypothetical protein
MPYPREMEACENPVIIPSKPANDAMFRVCVSGQRGQERGNFQDSDTQDALSHICDILSYIV